MSGKRIFISHSSDDKPFVKKLKYDLELYAGITWVDVWELKVGDSIKQKINNAINENDYFCVVISQSSIESKWVKYEINIALLKELDKRNVSILPILLNECNRPKCIEDRFYADFRSNYEIGLTKFLEAIAKDKNRLHQIKGGFLGIHQDIPTILLERLKKVENYVNLNAVFYPLFTFTAATESIEQSINNHDCKYRIIFQDPSKINIDEIMQLLRKSWTKQKFCDEILMHVGIFKELKEKYPKNIYLKYTSQFPTHPMVDIDNRIFLGFYTYTSSAPTGLWIELSKNHEMSNQFVDNFNLIWESGREI